ncbi:carboxylating nicotinate-nucleotide diphosphorylase [Arthrobacter sp. NamB2]|uniref:carboxylating nicotinate-nucleotide diphosphorylase n=1 Tax=Arthrobacter sp. NamB2 TaxID=2576035 RepID=UPI0010C98EC1|nr:carboxylating nicotinate-nucleotide diphosphorylase [Arthrobacter sp. NamB2]TKV29820.1 carboxylating nicotinate-nucleotide diphosphorylase [Arthrobacter sp. NamB2]
MTPATSGTASAAPSTAVVLAPPPQHLVDAVVASALAEDAPWGDITCQALIDPDVRTAVAITAREPGILCGTTAIEAAMRLTDERISVAFPRPDGTRFDAGDTIADISGPASGILTAERTALNIAQRLSGIATMTRAFVDAVDGAPARIVDTRKTTPGLRVLERWAVRCGGGSNHRSSLSDAVMVKDNHLALLALDGPEALTQALRDVRSRLPHTVHVEVEVDRLEQIGPVLAAGVDTIMLDNFSLDDLAEGVRVIGGRALVEASGNVRLDTVAAIAATGVDIISAGALTHSVRSLDLGLDFDLQPDRTGSRA